MAPAHSETEINKAWSDVIGHTLDSLVARATKNGDSAKLVLGKFADDDTSYTAVADQLDATYFSLKDWDYWSGQIGEENMWQVNRKFLEEQIEAGKSILFSHNPNIADGFFGEEVRHLAEQGFTEFEELANGFWRIIK